MAEFEELSPEFHILSTAKPEELDQAEFPESAPSFLF